MKNNTLTTLFLIFISNAIFAQNQQSVLKDKFSIDLYSSDQVSGISPYYLQGNYNISPSFSTGLYLAYSQEKNSQYKANNIFIGSNTRYYPIENTKTLSPYLSGKIGFIITNYKNYSSHITSSQHSTFDYGAYGGAKLKVIKPLTIFGEIGYGKYDFVRFGISLNL